SVGLEERPAFLAHRVGHGQDQPIALNGGDQRQTDPRVAARRLDDRATRRERALALGGLDHRAADAILDAAARIEILELRPHLRADTFELRHARETDDGRRADQIERRARDLRGQWHGRVARKRETHDIGGVRDESIERVVVVFPGALGDLLLALPALRLLRARHAAAHLVLVVNDPLRSLAARAGLADATAGLSRAPTPGPLGAGRLPPRRPGRP